MIQIEIIKTDASRIGGNIFIAEGSFDGVAENVFKHHKVGGSLHAFVEDVMEVLIGRL